MRVVEIERRTLGPQHPDTIDAMISMADLQLQEQMYAPAEKLVRDVLSSLEKTNPDSWKRSWTQALLGAILAGQQRYAEGEPLLLSGYRTMVQNQANIPREPGDCGGLPRKNRATV